MCLEFEATTLTHSPKGSCVCQENTSDYSMMYCERPLHNCFIPWHRKYSGQHNQCDIRAAHDGKVGYNTVEYTKAFMNSDWLYFLWHGINMDMASKEEIKKVFFSREHSSSCRIQDNIWISASSNI